MFLMFISQRWARICTPGIAATFALALLTACSGGGGRLAPEPAPPADTETAAVSAPPPTLTATASSAATPIAIPTSVSRPAGLPDFTAVMVGLADVPPTFSAFEDRYVSDPWVAQWRRFNSASSTQGLRTRWLRLSVMIVWARDGAQARDYLAVLSAGLLGPSGRDDFAAELKQLPGAVLPTLKISSLPIALGDGSVAVTAALETSSGPVTLTEIVATSGRALIVVETGILADADHFEEVAAIARNAVERFKSSGLR